YGWVQKGLGTEMLHTPLLIILALPLARILATGLSIGTGGSGGVFGPGMVIGAFTGLAVWRVLEPFAPGVGHDPAPFVIVGMMAVFGGISRAPIAVMLMVAQMTGSIALLGPAMIAVAIAWFIVGRSDDSIYRSQLRTRADSAASRLHFGLPLLATLSVASVASDPTVVLHDHTTTSEALQALREASVPGAPVVDAHGTYLGTVDIDVLSPLADQSSTLPVAGVLDATTTTVAIDTTLDVGLEALTQAGGSWVTVTSKNRHVVGILAIGDLVRGYRQALDANVGKIDQVTAHAVAVEERVGRHSKLIGRSIRTAGLPAGCVVITVQHGNELLFATGTTTLAEGDVVSALTSPQSVDTLRQLLRGTAEPEQEQAETNQDSLGAPTSGTATPRHAP
ncbi:MAG: chloride channel protein, partial [Acidimicrobiales bacterium]